MQGNTDKPALPTTATVREARNIIIESRHSRLPIYRDQIDNVEGIIYLRDLLPSLSMGKADAPIEPFIRPFYAVPETKYVADLLLGFETGNLSELDEALRDLAAHCTLTGCEYHASAAEEP